MRAQLEYFTSRGRLASLSMCLLFAGHAMAAEPLVDPTQPYGERAVPRASGARVTPAGLHLEAILHSTQRRVAIINGQLVREGDRLANNLIESITPTTVRYSTQGQQHTLSLAAATLPEAQLSIRPSSLIQIAKDTRP
jgi:hypothetical protein